VGEYLLLWQMELGVLVRCLSYLKRLILPQAAIFDVDGTLLDSVDLHAIAWQEALTKFGGTITANWPATGAIITLKMSEARLGA
jgi:hypothetical protein